VSGLGKDVKYRLESDIERGHQALSDITARDTNRKAKLRRWLGVSAWGNPHSNGALGVWYHIIKFRKQSTHLIPALPVGAHGSSPLSLIWRRCLYPLPSETKYKVPAHDEVVAICERYVYNRTLVSQRVERAGEPRETIRWARSRNRAAQVIIGRISAR
jgi:hypothetical protein